MRGLDVAQDVLLRIQNKQTPASSERLAHAATQQLELAFGGKDRALRGRAATAWMAVLGSEGVGSNGSDAALAFRARVGALLANEKDRPHRLLLALALGAQDAQGLAALQDLAKGKDVPAAQAAAQLAHSRDAAARSSARKRLHALMQSPQPAVRSTVAPALARLLELRAARTALLDTEARVRIATAAALLRAIASLEAQSQSSGS
jgi:hypothetical protein